METLFGHQDSIVGVDSLTRERAITAGGRDGSVRIWKIVEESQLVFQGHKGSIDCVKLVNEQHFLSGGDDGYAFNGLYKFLNCSRGFCFSSLCLWGMLKKKPLVTIQNAHGSGEMIANWITALAAHKNTDLVASGMNSLLFISSSFSKCILD